MNTKYRQILTRTLFLIVLLAYPLAASALGVGSLSVQSKLNQKLDAQIELLSTEGVPQSQIKAALAKASIFKRAGVDYSPDLGSIDLDIATQADGTPYIKVSSKKPLQEPVIDFILEVKWQQQRLLRKFTIMLDPAPIVKTPEAPAPEKTVVAQNKSEIEPVQPKQSTTPIASHKPQTTQSVANTSIKVYEVKTSKDTLWSIATRFRTDKSHTMDQVMKAILKQNPSAFLNNNINLLKTGSTLRFDPALLGQTDKKPVKPAATIVKQATPEENTDKPSRATGEIKTHKVKRNETLWSIATSLRSGSTHSIKKVMNALLAQNPNAFHNNDISQLKKGSTLNLDMGLLGGTRSTKATPEKALATPVTKSTKHVQVTPLPAPAAKEPEHISSQKILSKTQEKKETVANLIQTINKIQQQILEMQRLLKNKQSELARLKGEARLTTENASAASVTPMPSPIESPLTTEPSTKQTPIDRSQQSAIKQVDATPKTSTSNAQDVAKSSTIADTTKSVTTPPIDAIENPGTQEEGLLSQPLMIGLGAALLGLVGLFLYRRSKNNEENFDIDDKELEDAIVSIDLDQAPTFEQQLQQSEEEQKPEIATDVESGEGVQLDSDLRALYEADIYIACQRYSRAEESLVNAIELNPERIEIKLKLLEVYLATQDRDKFISAAEIIYNKIGEHDPKWQSVVDMGKQLCPDYPLFDEKTNSDETILSSESTIQNNEEPKDDPLALNIESDPPNEEPLNNEFSLNLEQSDDIFKDSHDSPLDLDESDLFAGQANKTEEQDTDLSSILMDDDPDNDENSPPPKAKEDTPLHLDPDSDDLPLRKASR